MYEPQPGTLIGRWEVTRLLGRGGMAAVFLVRDTTGATRALKLMHAGSNTEDFAARFQREFRALSRLHHPNIAAVADWGTWERRPYFVMEYVEGVDLRVLAEEWQLEPPAVRFARVRSVIAQVASALAYVHERGLVHRDVTPSNVLVTADGTARLMDFGVVKEPGAEMTNHGDFLGTVAYVAPEQITGAGLDARADLYSLGAVFYLLLTGRRPFHARTLAGYLEKHLHQAPRPPRELAPDVPEDLEAICLRLLEKSPAARFASASHLLQQLGGPPPVSAGAAQWPPVLVGRVGALGRIEGAINQIHDGHGGILVIEGASGTGKTRLIRLAAETAARGGVLVTRARAMPDDGPLGLFRRLYQQLVEEGIPAPRRVHDVFGGEGGGIADRFAFYADFREMLVARLPRLVAVDDLHAADAGSVEMAEYLIRNTRAMNKAPIYWLFTVTPDVASAELGGILAGQRTGAMPQRVVVGALEPAQVEELVGALCGVQPAVTALALRIHRDTAGNPAFIAELLRGLVDEGLLRPRDGRYELGLGAHEVEQAVLPVPASLRQALLGRLLGLSTEARRAGEVLALARAALPEEVLADVTGFEEEALERALDALEGTGFVRVIRGELGASYEYSQPRVRDLVRAEIAAEPRRALHLRIGEVLERYGRGRPNLVIESLAWHFECAGAPLKAYSYLFRVGQRLLDRSFVAEAEAWLARALAAEPAARALLPLDDADRNLVELLLRRAEALEHLGRWEHSSDDLRRAALLAREIGDERLCSRAEAALGHQVRHDGMIDVYEAHFREALRLAERVGDARLRGPPLNGLGISAWSRGDLEGARRMWVEAMAVAEASGDERTLGSGQNGLGLVALCRGQSAEARRWFEQGAAVFERLGQLGLLSTVRCNLIEIHHFTGNLRRGMELADRALTQAKETYHPLGVARGHSYRGLLLTDLSRHQEALAEGHEALRCVQELGDPSEELSALALAIRSGWAAGDLGVVAGWLDQAEELVSHDPEGFGLLLTAWRGRLHAARGEPDAAKAAIHAVVSHTGTRWPYQECRLELVLARTWLALGDRPEACRLAEAAVRRADACGFRLYALRAHCLAARAGDDDATVARHWRVADGLARSLAANLPRDDAERFLRADWLVPPS